VTSEREKKINKMMKHALYVKEKKKKKEREGKKEICRRV
jgi:hypothetical protein